MKRLASGQRKVGDTLAIYVDARNTSDNTRADDGGWTQIMEGGLSLLVAIGLGMAVVPRVRRTRQRRRRTRPS